MKYILHQTVTLACAGILERTVKLISWRSHRRFKWRITVAGRVAGFIRSVAFALAGCHHRAVGAHKLLGGH